MDIKKLIGETSDYDKKLMLEKRDLKAGVKALVLLPILLVES